jgi:hypothetical protein
MSNAGLSGANGSHGQDECNIDYVINQQCIFELLGITNCMFNVNDILVNISSNTKFRVIYFNMLLEIHILHWSSIDKFF